MIAKAKKVPKFTFGVKVQGMPVKRFTIKASIVVETTAVKKIVRSGTLDKERTVGPMKTTQDTVKKAATFVMILPEIAALRLPSPKKPLTPKRLFTRTPPGSDRK